MAAPLEISLTQLRHFRAQRGHLIGPGAPDPVRCAEDILGAQAQVDSCALYALSARTQGRPTAAALSEIIYDEHGLVRTWGQRGTLHLYAQADLPRIAGARPTWTSGRRGGMPSEALVAEVTEIFRASAQGLTRTDLLPHIPQSYIESLEGHPGVQGNPARFAATRLIWVLARDGVVVHAEKQGAEQRYAHRSHWCPDLPWSVSAADAANAALGRRYLRAFGPATLRDMAYHFGAKISDTRRWAKGLQGDTIAVRCGERGDLLALAEDAEALQRPAEGPWPVRLLPAYDTAMMGHKDKTVILPDSDEAPLVWQSAARVAATVIAEGQIVATWRHTVKGKSVRVDVQPLKGWRAAHLGEVEAEAAAFAAHLGRTLSAVEVAR